MLPNWLLGKSKSKLQEILGGGGGGGTTYTAGDGIDISNGVISFDPATSPAIDPSKVDGLDDDLAALAPKTAITNPNLLDNPWFTVNQRGQSSYTNVEAYTVDRWKLRRTAAACTLSVTDDGVIISASDATDKTVFIAQYFEEDFIKSLNGKTITASALKPDGTILKGTIESFNYQTSKQLINIAGFVFSYEAYNNKYNFRIMNWSQSDITIRAVKLELGSVSTLAMDTAPNYATELLKCQRYFYRCKAPHAGFYFGLAIVWDTNKMSTVLSVPCMRSVASVTASNFSDFLASKGSSAKSPHDISNFENFGQSEQNHATGLVITTSESDLTSGDIYVLKAVNTSAYIDFSADL